VSAQHSAGNWRVYPLGTSVPGYQVHAGIVSDAPNGRSLSDGPSEADLALMAAAPELLAALQPFVGRNCSDEHITITVRTADITRARSAIARATRAAP
jgi:hypothetical protein